MTALLVVRYDVGMRRRTLRKISMTIFSRRFARKVLSSISERLTSQSDLRLEMDRVKKEVLANTPGNPAIYGYKIYSQCDEDGIIANIFSRIGEGGRTFVEIGCSDGLENNTHALLLQGWRGVWVDADKDKIDFVKRQIQNKPSLSVLNAFISVNNAEATIKAGMEAVNINVLDFLSLDIDGADLYVIKELSKSLNPRVICVEYNTKFPPPLKISVQPNPGAWQGDDYHGASLCSFVDVLGAVGYTLVACSLSGANAFFVQSVEAAKFPASTPAQLYQPARYELRHLKSGHPASLKFLRDLLLHDTK